MTDCQNAVSAWRGSAGTDGASGGPELLAAQRDYLDTVEAITREHEPTLPVDPARVDAVREAIEARYPDLGHAVFLRIGVPAVYRRLAEAS